MRWYIKLYFFELFLVQDAIVEIQHNDPCSKFFADVLVGSAGMRANEIGPPGINIILQQLPHHAIELGVVYRGPKSIFITGIITSIENIEIALEMIRKREVPHLFSGMDVQYAFET